MSFFLESMFVFWVFCCRRRRGLYSS